MDTISFLRCKAYCWNDNIEFQRAFYAVDLTLEAPSLAQKLGKFRLAINQIGEAMVDVFPLQDFA
jgi:hypothetical protein